MTCSVKGCFGLAVVGALCRRCRDKRDSLIVIGVCFGVVAFIICMAKLGRMI